MSEVTSSLVEASLVFAVCLPLATFVSKAVLALSRRRRRDVAREGSPGAFLLIVAPSLATLLWFASAAIHAATSSAGASVCSLEHTSLERCADAFLLVLVMIAVVVAMTRTRWRRSSAGRGRPVPGAAEEWLARLCARNPALGSLAGRVHAVEGAAHPICTRGLLRPRVEVDVGLMVRLDDDALEAALLHELAHVDGRDPLRYLVAEVALALNPLGALLRPDLGRWQAAREAACDRDAVEREGDPLALAQAIVCASRLGRPLPSFAAGITRGPTALLRLRVELLLDYARRPPRGAKTSPLWCASTLLLAVFLSPHILGAWPLRGVHAAADRILSALGLI